MAAGLGGSGVASDRGAGRASSIFVFSAESFTVSFCPGSGWRCESSSGWDGSGLKTSPRLTCCAVSSAAGGSAPEPPASATSALASWAGRSSPEFLAGFSAEGVGFEAGLAAAGFWAAGLPAGLFDPGAVGGAAFSSLLRGFLVFLVAGVAAAVSPAAGSPFPCARVSGGASSANGSPELSSGSGCGTKRRCPSKGSQAGAASASPGISGRSWGRDPGSRFGYPAWLVRAHTIALNTTGTAPMISPRAGSETVNRATAITTSATAARPANSGAFSFT